MNWVRLVDLRVRCRNQHSLAATEQVQWGICKGGTLTLPGHGLSNLVAFPQPRGHLKPVLRFLQRAGRLQHARDGAGASFHQSYDSPGA